MKITELEQADLKKVTLAFTQMTPAEESQLVSVAEKIGCKIAKAGNASFISMDLQQLEGFIVKYQTFRDFTNEVATLKQILNDKKIYWKGKNFTFDLTYSPLIYSIVNCTPDSFYAGSQYTAESAVLRKVENDLLNGAAVIELGGQSTRPNFKQVSQEEEWLRIGPIIKAIKKNYPNTILSVDTSCPYVMERVLAECGVDIINDVDGFENPALFPLIEAYQPSLVVMNNGRITQTNNLEKLVAFFEDKLQQLSSTGINQEFIAIDPGIGFSSGGDLQEDLMRIKSMTGLRKLKTAMMIAISRKSFIQKLFDLEVEERLIQTLLFECLMIQDGGRILRVHDVKETRNLLETMKYYER